MSDINEIEAEILRLTCAIDTLAEAKETMDAFGVPFTMKQDRMLDWDLDRRLDLERLLMVENEEFNDENPEHSKVTHDETLWDGDALDLMDRLLRGKGKLH